ncbi:STAS domain-containing protein [Streptomyces paludis]|uniref:STAS domain-containing protein n=1 Tax=Streptomyces paludis TaxID=2282738 RepID=A0A345HT77_9ACTN|nr:STAS domain-containing protein [Streptomyces paludis]AXG79901.1 STAS domain-containing protein [Streptomyces paludis]
MDVTEPILLAIAGRVTPAEVPTLSGQLETALRAALPTAGGRGEVICDVGGLVQPGLAAVDVLARLRLAARRQGCGFQLRGVGRELRLLLELVGLAELGDPRDTAQADDGADH